MGNKRKPVSRTQRKWLVNGSKGNVTGTATQEMLSGSVSQAAKPRVTRGGTRYSDRKKYPVEVRYIT